MTIYNICFPPHWERNPSKSIKLIISLHIRTASQFILENLTFWVSKVFIQIIYLIWDLGTMWLKKKRYQTLRKRKAHHLIHAASAEDFIHLAFDKHVSPKSYSWFYSSMAFPRPEPAHETVQSGKGDWAVLSPSPWCSLPPCRDQSLSVLLGPLSGIWAGTEGGISLPCTEGRPCAGAPQISSTSILPTSLVGALLRFTDETHLGFKQFQ